MKLWLRNFVWIVSVTSSLFGFALLANAAPASSEGDGAQKQPNIVFIFSDDHAFQAVGAYGSRINETPNIDRIARDGMRFDRCYVPNSICGPSRATILTGKYSHLNGFFHNGSRFDGSQQTFPKMLQKAGYQTAVIGKWHLKSEPTGFDFWHVLPGQGMYYNPPMRTANGPVKHTGYVTDIITDLTLDWLKNQRDADKPFMLMCQHKAPHRAWMPGPKYLTKYDGEDIPEPETLFDDYSNRASPARNQKMTISEHMSLSSDLKVDGPETNKTPREKFYQRRLDRMTPEQRKQWDAAYGPKNKAFREANLKGKDLVRWKYQRYIKDYLRSIASVDDSVGELLDYLDETGLADNTIVVYCSDQGFYLGEHGWYDKRWMYEESLRTPLVVKWPGKIKPGSVNDDIVSNLDFAETFLDIAGVEIPSDMQGESLVPILGGNTPEDWRDSFYYQFYEGPPAVHFAAAHYGVTNGKQKLIFFPDTKEWEMFDLTTDPNEMMSIYGKPEHAALQATLEKEMARLRKDLQVPDKDPPGAKRKFR